WIHKMEMPDSDDRAASDFRILLRSPTDHLPETVVLSDVVIDTSGRNDPTDFGTGGLYVDVDGPAHAFPLDITGSIRDFYQNKHTLVIGSGCSAANSVIELAELHDSAPRTRVTWVTRREVSADQPGPALSIIADRLPQRTSLIQRANRL